MLVRTVNDNADIENLRRMVREAAAQTRVALDELPADPMEALYKIRFHKFGYHYLGDDGRLNLFEQLNQTFHTMVQLAAARRLLEWFADCGGLRLHLGTTGGRDIESICSNVVEAEVFAKVHLSKSTQKLKDDIQSLAKSGAKNRYVFFYSPEYNVGRRCDLELPDSRVRVWALGLEEVM